MKFIILIIGLIVIGLLCHKDFESGGTGDISLIRPIGLWLLFIITWLIVFFVADVQLPTITL